MFGLNSIAKPRIVTFLTAIPRAIELNRSSRVVAIIAINGLIDGSIVRPTVE